MRHFIFILIGFVFFSCHRIGLKGDIIPQKEFVSILVDIHIMDAMVTDYSLSSYLHGLDSLTIYSSIMKQHSTTGESFRRTLDWYSQRPQKLSELYDEVFGKINKKDQDLNEQLKLFTSYNKKDIYNSNNHEYLKGDSAKLPEPIVIRTRGEGIYTLDMQIRMLEADKSQNPRVLAYFLKDSLDSNPSDTIGFANFPIQKSNYSRDYQFSYKLTDSTYKFLEVIAPAIDNTDSTYRKDFQVSTIRISKIEPENPIEKEKEIKNEKEDEKAKAEQKKVDEKGKVKMPGGVK